MSGFHDFLIDPRIEDLAGWSQEAAELDTIVLEASEWGELKRKIDQNREEADVLVFDGDSDVNPKACEDPRLDIILASSKKDERIAQATAKAALENEIAIALDFSTLKSKRVEELKAWRKNLRVLEKYDTDYIVTTNADAQLDIRAPRDIAALIGELGGDGEKAVKDVPQKILKDIKERNSQGYIGKGVEEL